MRRLTLCGAGLTAIVAISVALGLVDYSRAGSGRRIIFSRQRTLWMGGGCVDYLGLGYRVRVLKSVSAGPIVPVSRDSVGADPKYYYTRRGAELRFVFLPHTFETVHHFKWLKSDFMPPPDTGGS